MKKTAATDGLKCIIMWRNKERETEAMDVGVGSHFDFFNETFILPLLNHST